MKQQDFLLTESLPGHVPGNGSSPINGLNVNTECGYMLSLGQLMKQVRLYTRQKYKAY